MQQHEGRQTPRRHFLALLGLQLLALAGCGTEESVSTVVQLREPSPTRLVATATNSATPTHPPITSTATATLPAATSTTAVTRVGSPVATGSYEAEWSGWFQGEDPGKSRRIYDRATNEYRVTILDETLDYSFYAPGEQTFTDFVLEAEVYRLSGEDTIGYGLVFRRQPRGPNDAASVRLIFYVTAQGFYSLVQVNADGSARTLQPLGPGPPGVIKTAGEVNRLRVLCKGDRVTLNANGEQLGAPIAVTVRQPGEIGIYVQPAFGANTTVGFKSLRLTPAP